MILPIVAYGSPVLRTRCAPVSLHHPGLRDLIGAMWDTLAHADGAGLAAPQVGESLRLFLVDSTTFFAQLSAEEQRTYPDAPGIRRVFLNATITGYGAEQESDLEGCLSIPGLRARVRRPTSVTLRYSDEHGREHEDTFTGPTARMIQHEYDHIEGRLYIDYLSSLRRHLLQPKLDRIVRGDIQPPYPMVFGGSPSVRG